MKLRTAFWASVCAFSISILLYFLRLLNVLGSEYDILISWVSTISLILLGVFIGVLISEKTRARGMLIRLFIVAVGFICIPLVVGLSATLVNTFPLAMEIKLVIACVLSLGYLVGYMAFLFWLKKKGIFKVEEVDSTETET